MPEELGREASKRSLLALDTLYLIRADVQGGLGPFLAVYLASVHHWDPARIGTVMAVMEFVGLASQTPAGMIIDAVKDKRVITAAAFALVGLGALTMVLMPTPAVILSAQALIGTAGPVFGPAMASISLALAGHAGLSRRMGRNQALDHAGNVVAALVAGLIGDTLGYGAIFGLTACMCLGGVVVTLLIRREDLRPSQSRGPTPESPGFEGRAKLDTGRDAPDGNGGDPAARVVSLRELFGDRRVLLFAASVILFHFANAAMLPLVGQKLALGLTGRAALPLSACIIAAQLVMIPVALVASRLAVSWGRKPTLLIGFAVLPLRGALYVLSDNPSYLVAVQMLDGIAAGIFGVVGILVIADLTEGTGRFNFTQGALATATGIGAAMSNLVTGAVVEAAGFDAGFLMLAAIAAAALVFFAVAMPETGRSGGVARKTLPDHPASAIAVIHTVA